MLSLRFFNGFTCNARWPSRLKTGLVCTLVETEQGPVLIDTGPGLEDYRHPHAMLRIFRAMFDVPCHPGEAAANQVRRLGHNPEGIHHIVLTHMHFDHCGGLADFPQATVHIHAREYAAFTGGRLTRWTDMAYVARHLAHRPQVATYAASGERWFDFEAIRLPFTPEMWLVPLFGHTCGHCGVAVRTPDGWFFNAGDAGAVYNDTTPAWLIRLVLGPHDARLRAFMRAHPEVQMVNSHMLPEFFASATAAWSSQPDP